MDLTLILLGFAILVVIYLIFKFIKKLVFAIFTLIFVVILIIAGVFGVVYMDFNYLTSQSDFDLKIVYQADEKLLFGTNIEIKNQTTDMKSIKSISSSELSKLNPKEINSDDKVFVVVVDEELLKVIMTSDDYQLPGLNESTEFKKYDLTLTKFEVIEVLDATDSNAKFIELVVKKNKLSVVEKALFETFGEGLLEDELKKQGVTLKEALFLTVMMQELENEKNAIKLVEGFKEETLMVYPERFSFKLVRILPVDTIKGFLPDFAK